MRRRFAFATALALLAGSLLAPLRGQTPTDRTIVVDRNHTMIGFKAATFLFGVPGRFEKYAVDLKGNPDAADGATVKVSIDTASINTAIKSRDEHLRSADFLDAAKYPKITFTSSKVWHEGGKLMAAGSLDLHGVQKDLTLAFEEAKGKNGSGNDSWSYAATLPLNRKDFGVGADSVAAKISLKDTVELNLLLVLYADDSAKAAPVKKATPRKKG
ncbi:MAG TPA: YceI family protein [Holophagaceae bacterium]|nr:YceI family protein [Holophagaceae bacterium]